MIIAIVIAVIVVVVVIIIIIIIIVVVVVVVIRSLWIKPQKLKIAGDLGLGNSLKRMRKVQFVVTGTVNTRNHFH